uniref:Uncharacterized protein n=1 Tax=Romanomermis culicivorax TaxID=13658 RepID=A0A915I1Z6_ROMCU
MVNRVFTDLSPIMASQSNKQNVKMTKLKINKYVKHSFLFDNTTVRQANLSAGTVVEKMQIMQLLIQRIALDNFEF